MSKGCWVDLFHAEGADGERRRIFGPAAIEVAALGVNGAHHERLSFVVGPAATVVGRGPSGDEVFALSSGGRLTNVPADEVVTIEIRPYDLRPKRAVTVKVSRRGARYQLDGVDGAVRDGDLSRA